MNRDFNGIIDEVRIYNRALTPQEILQHFSEGNLHRADTNQDGCIKMNQLLDFIDLWNKDSTAYPMREMMEAVGLWKQGTGCS